MKMERPMTTAQVASALGVSRATILKVATRDADPLPSIKIGKHYRFFWSDVVKFYNLPADKLVESQTQTTQTQES
jgi:excisionase family DNA binding protein